MPDPCAATDFVTENCSREIKGASKKMKLSYWVNLVDNVPTFHGQIELTLKISKSYDKYDLRYCLELAEDG